MISEYSEPYQATLNMYENVKLKLRQRIPSDMKKVASMQALLADKFLTFLDENI